MELKLCEIVQEVERIDIEKVLYVLKDKKAVRDYAYIMHDKDETRPHYHIDIRFNYGVDTKYIAEWFSVPEQYVSKCKSTWADMLKYLTHRNAPDRYQYPDEDVVSNFDWKKEVQKAEALKDKYVLMEMIVDGTIKEYNIDQYIPFKKYDMYKKSIDNAFKYRLNILKKGERNMECIFITGESGSGKTTYAKKFAKDKGMAYYCSSGSNDVLDDYGGEDCLILDDLRPSCIGLSDLLKMLDNNTSSTVKSRYRNKALECKYLIITTTLNIDTFFNNVFSEEKESIIQLKRRCKTHMRYTLDYIYVSIYQDATRDYSKEICYENPIKNMYERKEMTEDEMLQYINDTFGDLKHVSKLGKDNDFYPVSAEQLKIFQ